MIRFPNPGSDISSLILIFQTFFKELSHLPRFSLDQMSKTLVGVNLASSSGYVGRTALELSTREDRSRDPLYNQSKMYAELFRLLGWIVSDSVENILEFRFTMLGEHVVSAIEDPRAIFEECLLGINYPNEIIDVRGNETSRVFSAILRAAAKLDNHICRDEIILAILNEDDLEDNFKEAVNKIHNIRGDFDKLSKALTDLATTLGIQINTMHNYTRFPIAALEFTGWFEKVRTNIFYPNSRAIIMLKLTPYGEQRALQLQLLQDIRLSAYNLYDNMTKQAINRLGFYKLLERANFDTHPVVHQMENDKLALYNILHGMDPLFSPYQTIRPEAVDKALNAKLKTSEKSNYQNEIKYQGSIKQKHAQQTMIKIPLLNLRKIVLLPNQIGTDVGRKIIKALQNNKTESEIANKLFSECQSYDKNLFYPFVVELFSCIGFDCKVSRSGINYERWDAIVIDTKHSIPIEIKSPMEEQFLSLKAIRQALENKIILLSRKAYPTDIGTTTLAVGYNMPNNRAEVSRLIEDIKKAFGIKIGVIDLFSLIRLAIAVSVGHDKKKYMDRIREMEGLIDVAYT